MPNIVASPAMPLLSLVQNLVNAGSAVLCSQLSSSFATILRPVCVSTNPVTMSHVALPLPCHSNTTLVRNCCVEKSGRNGCFSLFVMCVQSPDTAPYRTLPLAVLPLFQPLTFVNRLPDCVLQKSVAQHSFNSTTNHTNSKKQTHARTHLDTGASVSFLRAPLPLSLISTA